MRRKVIAVVGVLSFIAITRIDLFAPGAEPPSPVAPDWTAIAAWPPNEVAEVQAVPDPNRNFTAIVFDDSGSMSAVISDARDAVITALDAMQPQDKVAVFALNSGEVLPFVTVADARGALPGRIARVQSDGGTPLTRAVRASRAALALEAAAAGGYGTYRILVTTDGVADDGAALSAEIADIAEKTPVQVATIGLGVEGNHVLRRSDIAAFVSIDDVNQLADALKAAIAEEQSFAAITSFGSE